MSSPSSQAILLLIMATMAATGLPSVLSTPLHEQQAWLSQQQESDCQQFFASRHAMTLEEQRLVATQLQQQNASSSSSGSYCPALLWTYTGTGNTMTRMLIEAASGFSTGSVYTDLSLVDILPGEYLCDSSVIAVKAHPQWHSFKSLGPDGFRPDTPHVPPDAKDICPCAFDRAVAVIRDPYATFLAEYKRVRSHDYEACSEGLSDGEKACTGGHVSVIHKADFNASDFRVEVIRMATEWAAMFDSYDAFAAAHPQGFYLTTFENLTSPRTRAEALAGLLTALGVPPHHPHLVDTAAAAFSTDASGSDCAGLEAAASTLQPSTCAASSQDSDLESGQQCTSDKQQQQAGCGAVQQEERQHLQGYDSRRLQCAFDLARHPQIYRPKDPQGVDAAYVYSADNTGLVCDVWGIVGSRAAGHGYRPYGGITC